MTMRDTDRSYGLVTRVMHWLLVLLVLAQFTLALMFTWLTSKVTLTAMALHQSLGVIILATGAAFAVWRLCQPKPTLAGLSAWQCGLAHTVHLILYTVIIAQPLFGLTMDMAQGYSIPFFGLFSIPPLIPTSKAVGQFFATLHFYTGWWVILIALAIHVLATVYHKYVAKDHIARRMWRGKAS